MRWLPKHTTGTILAAGLILPAVLASVYFDHWWILLFPLVAAFGILGWDRPRIVLGLLWISLPLSVEFSFSDRLGTDLPDEALMIGVSILACLQLVFRPNRIAASIWRHPLFILYLLWMGWMAISASVSTTPWLSVKFMLAKSWYAGAFVFATLIWVRNREDMIWLFRCVFIPLVLIGVFALIRHAFSGFSFIAASAVVRPFFRNHVMSSAMLVTSVPVLYFCFKAASHRGWWRLLLVLILTALFFSYARGAWLALIVGGIAYFLVQRRLLLYGYVGALLILALGFIWLKQDDRYLRYAPDYRTTIFHSDFAEHWQATYQGTDVSTAERFYRWTAGVRMVADRPWTGFGPATFYSAYQPYAIPAYKTWVSNNPDRSTVHNYFLLTAAEQGLPGLLIFLILFGALLYYAERIYHRSADTWVRSVAAGTGVVVAMIGVLNFWSDLIETDKIGSLFFLSIGLLLILDRRISDVGAADVERVA